jgi:hypothetical protein
LTKYGGYNINNNLKYTGAGKKNISGGTSMKKTLLFLTAAVFVFAMLSSCGKSDTPTTPEAEPTPNATQTAVAGPFV